MNAVRSLLHRAGVGLTANVVQQRALRISRLAVDSPALILLRQGEKTLRCGTRSWRARGGDVVVVAAGQNIDVENRLSADGLFEARWVVWDAALLARAGPLVPGRPALPDVAVVRSAGAGFVSAVDRAVEAIGDASAVPDKVAAHRLAELLVWLAEQGITLSGGRTLSTA